MEKKNPNKMELLIYFNKVHKVQTGISKNDKNNRRGKNILLLFENNNNKTNITRKIYQV